MTASLLSPSVQVTSPGAVEVEWIVTFCFSVVLSVEVKSNGFEVVSSFVIGEDEALVDVLVDSVIGFLLVVTVEFGRFVALRVTVVDLTVEVLVVGLLEVVYEGFVVALRLTLSSESDSTENVVTSISSDERVVGSTLTIKSVGVGLGRGAFVVSTKEIVVKTAGVVEMRDDVEGILVVDVVGFLVVIVAFLREEVVGLRFTVTFVGATGFLVVFITVDVVFFVGFNVVTGLLVGFTELFDETDVRLNV